MAIAQFPDFTLFDFSLKEEYDEIYKRFEPYSDFSFGNLAIWLNQYQDLRISLLHGNLVIECRNLFADGKHILSVIGDHEIDSTISILFDYLQSSGLRREINLVPEVIIDAITHKKHFIITEEPDNNNYILSTESLSSLEGSNYGRLRRQVHGFEREYEGRYSLVEYDLHDPAAVDIIINGIHLWDKIYTDNDQEKQESFVINSSLSYAKQLGFKNLSLLVDGQIQAIALYQLIPQHNYVIGNHTKSNHSYRNSFNYLLHKLAVKLENDGVEFINFEQDLGIPGLREHKTGLRPVRFLKHYSISELDTSSYPT